MEESKEENAGNQLLKVDQRRTSELSSSALTPDDSYGAMVIDPLPADGEKTWEPPVRRKANAIDSLLISASCASYWFWDDLFWLAWAMVGLYIICDIIFIFTLAPEYAAKLPTAAKFRMLIDHALGLITVVVGSDDNIRKWFCAFWIAQIVFGFRDSLSFCATERRSPKSMTRMLFFARLVYIGGVVGFFASDEIISEKPDLWTVIFFGAILALSVSSLLTMAGTIRRFIKRVRHSPDPAVYFMDILIVAIFVENFVYISLLLVYIPDNVHDNTEVGFILTSYFGITAWATYFQGAWSDNIGVGDQIFWITVIKTIGVLVLYGVRDESWEYTCLAVSAASVLGSIYTPYKVLATRRGSFERNSDLVSMFIAILTGSMFGLFATSIMIDYVTEGFFFAVMIGLMFSIAWIIGLLYRLEAVQMLNRGVRSNNPDQPEQRHISRMETIQPIRLPLAIQFFNAMTLFAIFSQFLVYMEDNFDVDLVEGAGWFGLVMFIRVLGAAFLAFGTGTDQRRSKGVANTIAALNVFFLGFGVAKNDKKGVFLLVCCISSFCLQFSQADFLFEVESRTSNENLGKALGIHDAFDMLGAALGSLIGGLLADSDNKGILYGAFALSILLLILVVWDSINERHEVGKQQTTRLGQPSVGNRFERTSTAASTR